VPGSLLFRRSQPVAISEELQIIDAFRCEACEAISEETSDEPLYQCGSCESKGSGEDGRRCEDCNKNRKKVEDCSCSECGEGPVEAIEVYHCDRCGENIDSGGGDGSALEDHIGECFSDDVIEEAAKVVIKDAARVQAIECPSCEKLFAEEDGFVEHFAEDGCDGLDSEKESFVSEEVAAIDSARVAKKKQDREEAEKKKNEAKAAKASKLETTAKLETAAPPPGGQNAATS